MPTQGIEVLVTFPDAITTDVQGPALMHLEMELRKATGLDVRVVKDLKGDDSKLRAHMTPIQRSKL